MRLQQIEIGGVRIINDAYNANPNSCRAAIDVLVDCDAKRRVYVGGDMLELGPDSEELHAELGRNIASRPVEMVIGIGPLGRIIAENAERHGQGKQTAVFDTVESAAAGIGELLVDGDVILLKGSRAMGLETWDKPAMACLASRFPYGHAITAGGLSRVERAEYVLKDMGFGQRRVRDHDTIARIEVPEEDVPRAAELHRHIATALKDLGYAYVTLDLEGFRSGSMNETLADDSPA